MTDLRVKLRYLDDADRNIALPVYETAGAAGMDLRANFPSDQRCGVAVQPGARLLIPTGLAIEIPKGFEAQIRPRSGLALKHGITIPNAPGTVDSDYRGPIGVIVLNTSQTAFPINHGDRVAQMVFVPVVQATWDVSDALSETKRGSGGFGSTGQS